jgi:hypothetical protein
MIVETVELWPWRAGLTKREWHHRTDYGLIADDDALKRGCFTLSMFGAESTQGIQRSSIIRLFVRIRPEVSS